MDISRRALVAGGFAVVAGLATRGAAAAPKPTVTVYKTSTCGCCKLWIQHLSDHGFTVKAEDLDSLAAVKKKLGIPSDLHSCHTGVVEGFVVEGHVPADVVDKMLRERPAIVGIAVPGMPLGSPGMEVPGRPADRYQVLAFDRAGRTTVFAER